MARLHLRIGGMHCSFCSRSIERAYERSDGVREVSVSLAHDEALVDYDPELVDETTLRDTLRDVGYTIRDPDREKAFEAERRELRARLRRTLRGAAASALVALAMLGMWTGWVPAEVFAPRSAPGAPGVAPWPAVATGVLAAWVLLGPGREILRMALAGLRRRIFNQHVLLAFGAGGALGAGLVGFFLEGFPVFHFFGAAIFLMTYHLLSGWVATKVRVRSREAVRRLLDLRPDTARRVEDGQEREVPTDTVASGDRVRVRPGESVPVDGLVVDGRSTVDESVVTGEPVPAETVPGDTVTGGSINQSGTLLVEATAPGDGGFLSRVTRQVEEARALKPGVVQLVDRVLRYYVPAVLMTGAAAFLFWTLGWWALAGAPNPTRAVYALLTIYVMGYPCALGMATPLALIRGGGRAAEQGILMRSAESFQVFKDVDTVVLDKTGTLTEGEPRVRDVVAVGEDPRLPAREVLRLAAIAEQASEHPLGEAIRERAAREGLEDRPAPDDFEALVGEGVVARTGGRELVVGRPELLESRGIDVSPAKAALERIRGRGETAVLLAAEGRLRGAIGIGDRVRDGAADAIRQLGEMGVQPAMMTGDAETTARAVAEEVEICRVLADVLPGEKAEEVGRLQRSGRRVAFVGDGINDAPALTRADAGVAIGAGTDIAIEAADVVLVHARLTGVVEAFEVSRTSYRKTKQNLALAFAFNGLGVPAAATGLLHPAWAMAAMAASVSLVLANSFVPDLGLRVRRGPRPTPSARGLSTWPSSWSPSATSAEGPARTSSWNVRPSGR